MCIWISCTGTETNIWHWKRTIRKYINHILIFCGIQMCFSKTWFRCFLHVFLFSVTGFLRYQYVYVTGLQCQLSVTGLTWRGWVCWEGQGEYDLHTHPPPLEILPHMLTHTLSSLVASPGAASPTACMDWINYRNLEKKVSDTPCTQLLNSIIVSTNHNAGRVHCN